MELREFAERVLFATSLEEKLATPGHLTDANPGPALVTPETPGRPPHLRFKAARSGSTEFPTLRGLDQERERGRLLHFFANHELLATELMALVLLKFPNAPTDFRRGVLRTLRDEQAHTRLYLERMQSCGIAFGELPVSGQFWRAVAPMETPMDYVAGLSLTFEQANLDYCRHFAAGFATIGDAVTARLLDGIYRDEIGHVAYGLKWFRRWKDARLSDWEAFCRQLRFPLSPQRAKGIAFNPEGRRAAGLDDAFVAELRVFAQSKGRTPTVFVFHPFAEARIARGLAYTPPRHQRLLAQDLAPLPMFLAQRDDVVLVPQRPATPFLAGLQDAGFALPEFVEIGPEGIPPHSPLATRKLGRLRPWAWSPESLDLLAPLLPRLTVEPRTAAQCFPDGLARLYGKTWSCRFLHSLLPRWPGTPWLCPESDIGTPVATLDQALAAIHSIRARGHHPVLVKEDLGTAGGNALRLFEPALLPAHRRWMERTLEDGRTLVVEPWLDRLADFSIQLEMGPRELRLIGYTALLNDPRGQFVANQACPGWHRRPPASATAWLRDPIDLVTRLPDWYREVFSALEPELRALQYLGPIGIDAFVYRHPDGRPRLKPIVEINPRFTMGRLTLALMDHVHPGRRALFKLVRRTAPRRPDPVSSTHPSDPLPDLGPDEDWPSYARALRERFPLHLEPHPTARIREGVLFLTDPARAQVCLAALHIAP
ncbi:MAG: DUF455 family protein [Verrucomicrobiae bacterium]|nr:DUF455 family protein [Verrucomicrobiae bacterium]